MNTNERTLELEGRTYNVEFSDSGRALSAGRECRAEGCDASFDVLCSEHCKGGIDWHSEDENHLVLRALTQMNQYGISSEEALLVARSDVYLSRCGGTPPGAVMKNQIEIIHAVKDMIAAPADRVDMPLGRCFARCNAALDAVVRTAEERSELFAQKVGELLVRRGVELYRNSRSTQNTTSSEHALLTLMLELLEI